jgi:hypothetical protein
MSRALSAVAIVGLLVLSAACGGESSPSQPTGAGGAQVFHDTLNAPESRQSTRVWPALYSPTGSTAGVSGAVITDDFVPSRSGEIRRVQWQGGYCDGRFNVPHVAPQPSAQQFFIAFVDGQGAAPNNFLLPPHSAPDRSFSIPAEQVPHDHLFDLVPNSTDSCVNKGAAAVSYYQHSATLPRPVSVVAGRRYWLIIAADVGASQTVWGWRFGGLDNGLAVSVYPSVLPQDLAFRLTE